MLYGSRLKLIPNPKPLMTHHNSHKLELPGEPRSSHGFSLHQLPGPDIGYFCLIDDAGKHEL